MMLKMWQLKQPLNSTIISISGKRFLHHLSVLLFKMSVVLLICIRIISTRAANAAPCYLNVFTGVYLPVITLLLLGCYSCEMFDTNAYAQSFDREAYGSSVRETCRLCPKAGGVKPQQCSSVLILKWASRLFLLTELLLGAVRLQQYSVYVDIYKAVV